MLERIAHLHPKRTTGECIQELTTKLPHFKDFDQIRDNMAKFYQTKLSM